MESEIEVYSIAIEVFEDADEENISHREVQDILRESAVMWQHHPDEGPYNPEHILAYVANKIGHLLEQRNAE